jgi:Cation transporting ATPase, C-terminus
MWKQIIGMTIYITFVMVFLFFFLDNMWDLGDFQFQQEWFDTDGNASAKCVYFTMLFNCFMYLHIFNEFNCRKIRPDQINVFENLFGNFFFLAVISFTIAVQYFMIEYGGRMARCADLLGEQHAFCVLVGATSLIASPLIKLLPEQLTDKILLRRIINERADCRNDPLVNAYLKQANKKVTKGDAH